MCARSIKKNTKFLFLSLGYEQISNKVIITYPLPLPSLKRFATLSHGIGY